MLVCLTEEGVDYKVGAGDDIIATENGLLQSECAELAAATVGGLYWTGRQKT